MSYSGQTTNLTVDGRKMRLIVKYITQRNSKQFVTLKTITGVILQHDSLTQSDQCHYGHYVLIFCVVKLYQCPTHYV